MNVYIDDGEIYCEDCGVAMLRQQAGFRHAKRAQLLREHADNFADDGGGEADVPNHCGSGPNCKNALRLGRGTHRRKVGACLENPLTRDGVEYVMDKLIDAPDSVVVQFWASQYREELHGLVPSRRDLSRARDEINQTLAHLGALLRTLT